jgi:hypothetical protein
MKTSLIIMLLISTSVLAQNKPKQNPAPVVTTSDDDGGSGDQGLLLAAYDICKTSNGAKYTVENIEFAEDDKEKKVQCAVHKCFLHGAKEPTLQGTICVDRSTSKRFIVDSNREAGKGDDDVGEEKPKAPSINPKANKQ